LRSPAALCKLNDYIPDVPKFVGFLDSPGCGNLDFFSREKNGFLEAKDIKDELESGKVPQAGKSEEL
jgi:hypothetical protein